MHTCIYIYSYIYIIIYIHVYVLVYICVHIANVGVNVYMFVIGYLEEEGSARQHDTAI